MARPGNTSALRHGLYRARQERDRFRRQAEGEACAILKAAGLEADPLAGLVARQIGRLEAKVARLQEYHDRRGHFTKTGELRPSVLTEGKFIGDLLGEARRLFDELRARRPAGPPGGVAIYRAELCDGTQLFTDAVDPLTASALVVPAALPPITPVLSDVGDRRGAARSGDGRDDRQSGRSARAAGSPSDDRAPARPSPSAPDAPRSVRPPIARRSVIH
jgi:hypothetical protein